MPASEYDWTVTVEGPGGEYRETARASYSQETDAGMWQLVDADGRAVFETCCTRVVSARRVRESSAEPAAAAGQDVNNKAAAFAKDHGTFELRFDAGQNYVRPDDAPWALVLDGRDDGWAGFTAEEAIDFAAGELGKPGE